MADLGSNRAVQCFKSFLYIHGRHTGRALSHKLDFLNQCFFMPHETTEASATSVIGREPPSVVTACDPELMTARQ